MRKDTGKPRRGQKLPTGHQAKKRFGQNFLVDESIINHIIRSIHPTNEENICEIGPGQGALTQHLLEHCPRLNVIELDRDLVPILLAQFAKYPEFQIHQTDALQFSYSKLITPESPEPLRVVGNLPYNISTPLIFHLIDQAEYIHDMHFMLQKEVVQRLCAEPGSKQYGRLGVMAQYHCNVEYLFDVPPESFEPAPKVDSAIVRLTPHKNLPIVAKNLQQFEQLVKMAFSQRRKTLRNALKTNLDAEHVSRCESATGIDFSVRAEVLSIEQFVMLSDVMSEFFDNGN